MRSPQDDDGFGSAHHRSLSSRTSIRDAGNADRGRKSDPSANTMRSPQDDDPCRIAGGRVILRRTQYVPLRMTILVGSSVEDCSEKMDNLKAKSSVFLIQQSKKGRGP